MEVLGNMYIEILALFKLEHFALICSITSFLAISLELVYNKELWKYTLELEQRFLAKTSGVEQEVFAFV